MVSNNEIPLFFMEDTTRICCIKECYNIHNGIGLCSKHFKFYKKHKKFTDKVFLRENKVIDKGDYSELELYDAYGKVKGYAKCDKSDLDKLLKYKWYLRKDGYISAPERKNETITNKILMHSFLLGRKYIDHINHDKSDNRRINLRLVTVSQNHMNRRTFLNINKSGHKGVFWSESKNRWLAGIKVNKRDLHRKNFKKIEDAIKYRKSLEKIYFGEYVCNQQKINARKEV